MILGFADQIKAIGMAEHNLDPSKVFGQRDSFTRNTMQTLGTELGRNVKGDDIWLRYLTSWMILHHHNNGIEVFIISDVRFPNELDFIRKLGGKIVRIHAPERNRERLIKEGSINSSTSSHSSETALDNYDASFDRVLCNDPGYHQFKFVDNNNVDDIFPFHSILLQT